MKIKTITASVSCFLTAFVAICLLMPKEQPKTATISTPAGKVYHLSENALRRPHAALPEKGAPHLRGYFDWVQPADPPNVTSPELK